MTPSVNTLTLADDTTISGNITATTIEFSESNKTLTTTGTIKVGNTTVTPVDGTSTYPVEED